IAGKSIPAKTVGGDYYDFIELDDDRIVVCLGDVSGKGMPAALLMSNLQATFRGQDLRGLTPSEIMTRANRLLYRSTDPDKFATFFFGFLDSGTDVFHYCNAGHNNPVIVHRNGGSTLLDRGGLILGALEDSEYTDARIGLEKGDTILIYSDGISEARNSEDEEFGEERLPAEVVAGEGLSATELTDRIITVVNRFASGMPQMDDMTIVVIRRLE
ncbi:MAG TPA: PP2C family protein-serine/threonine phosphatase, partial [Candidatus Krumholzibacterium sp.]|nr:PP2C family protein-serine/threonine phosphatase [Candidatus Krumholzibacterium sp.]